MQTIAILFREHNFWEAEKTLAHTVAMRRDSIVDSLVSAFSRKGYDRTTPPADKRSFVLSRLDQQIHIKILTQGSEAVELFTTGKVDPASSVLIAGNTYDDGATVQTLAQQLVSADALPKTFFYCAPQVDIIRELPPGVALVLPAQAKSFGAKVIIALDVKKISNTEAHVKNIQAALN